MALEIWVETELSQKKHCAYYTRKLRKWRESNKYQIKI